MIGELVDLLLDGLSEDFPSIEVSVKKGDRSIVSVAYHVHVRYYSDTKPCFNYVEVISHDNMHTYKENLSEYLKEMSEIMIHHWRGEYSARSAAA